MQKLFNDVRALDQRCYEQFALSEDILMEHAASAMHSHIVKKLPKNSSVLIVCGSGHNGADGIALARLLHSDFNVKLYLHDQPKSDLAKLQLERAKAVGVREAEQITDSDLIVDALFGSGLNRALQEPYLTLLKELNLFKGKKLACDIPTGILQSGMVSEELFYADETITMGALKKALYSDVVKDCVGKIYVANLGVARGLYETDTNWKILDFSDLKLPFREKKNSHKGSFGHLSVLCGEKEGAAIIAGKSALNFGAGLVTLLSHKNPQIPYELMSASALPKNSSAICAGMGLGNDFDKEDLQKILIDTQVPLIIDADLFYEPIIKKLLQKQNVVITPHPKEFVSLLKLLNLADITVEQLQQDRFQYIELFSKNHPAVVLLLKGANPVITFENNFYINAHGTNKLSKGGSGDVLSGIIGALLAQGYTPLEAAINGSLAHTKAATKVEKNSYALTPNDLISELAWL